MAYGKWKILKEETEKEFGYSPDQLSRASHMPVICMCEECLLKTTKRFREIKQFHKCKSIIDGKKKCYKCKKFKQTEEFSKNRSTFDKYQKVCKECFSNYKSVQDGYKRKSTRLKTDIKLYLRNTVTRLKVRAKKKNIPFDLDKDDLYIMLLKQNSKCFYTNMEIKHNPGCHQHNSISVDRKDPLNGYTKDNIVLCLFSINSFKGMMSQEEFKQYIISVAPKLLDYAKG